MSSLASFFQKRNKKSHVQENNELSNLFSNTNQQKKEIKPISKPSSKKIKKQQSEMQEQVSEEQSPEIVNQKKKKNKKKTESIDNTVEKPAVKAKKQQQVVKIAQEKPQQQQNLQSTIFVGNVPLATTHSELKKYFGKFGLVTKLWFRSIPVDQNNKLPRKANHILKQYQQGADSMNAYIKFNTIQQAKKACSINGTLFNSKNIRVSMCQQYQIDFESTIFIGNLPHKIRDQDLWDKFASVGTILNVRVIRNKGTQQGIGIAYVRFANNQEMKKAITDMNGKKIGDRQMRIKKAVSKQRIQKKVRKIEQKKNKSRNNQAGTKRFVQAKTNEPQRQDKNKNRSGTSKVWNSEVGRTKPIHKMRPVHQKHNAYNNRPAHHHKNIHA